MCSDPGSDLWDLDPGSAGIIDPPLQNVDGSTGIIDPSSTLVDRSVGIRDHRHHFALGSTGIQDPPLYKCVFSEPIF